MVKKIKQLSVEQIVAVVVGMLVVAVVIVSPYAGVHVVSRASAQTWNQTATQTLVATSESNTATAYTNNLPVVIPITIGLGVFFFLFGWLMAIATGRRK